MDATENSALAVRLDVLQDLITDIKASDVFKKYYDGKVLENLVLLVKDNDAAFAELKNDDLTEEQVLEIREEMMRILEEHVKKHI